MAANVNKKTKETTIVQKVPTVFVVYSFSGVPKYGITDYDVLRSC